VAEEGRERARPEEPAPVPAAGPAPAAATPRRYVVFRAGAERFALALEAVREVVPPRPPFARVPRAGAGVRGAMNLRGRVVAVVDLAVLLGLDVPPLAGGQGQVLILDLERRSLGFLVEGVVGVEALAAPEPSSPGQLVRGVSELRGSAVSVLDPELLAQGAANLFGGG